MERLSKAEEDQSERLRLVEATAVEITQVSITDQSNCDLEMRVNNTGSTVMDLNDTDVLLENTYQTDWQADATVAGNGTTDVWAPMKQLVVTRTGLPVPPDSVTVVTDIGVTATEPTEELQCT